MFACVALLLGFLALQWLPRIPGALVAGVCGLVALGAATLSCAGAIVLVRYRRGALAEEDLFLELNRSRAPAAIESRGAVHVSWGRRWLAKRLLGHDLVVGDLVEIKTWPEILATLDERSRLDELPFMAEMVTMCGRRAYVFRCMHRLFDYRKTRRMRQMDRTVLLVGMVCDGSHHGGCEAACHTIWKAAWLRRIDPAVDRAFACAPSVRSELPEEVALRFRTEAPPYVCQLTQLHAASRPLDWRSASFLRPLVSGNVAPAAFVVGWLTHLFDDLQQRRGGVGYPTFEVAASDREADDIGLKAGDDVIVRSPAEIRATLNDQLSHRGLWFEPDMLKHCGRRRRVQAEVKNLIDIVSGEMRTMKTAAYILRDVHFSGERQLFNSQYEPLFWRSVWLQRDGD